MAKSIYNRSKKLDYNKLIYDALLILDNNKLINTHVDLSAELGIHVGTYYNYRINVHEDINKKLEQNNRKVCQELKFKWLNSNQPITQLALYKLSCTEDEWQRLTQQRQVISGDPQRPIQISVVSTEKGKELEAINTTAEECIPINKRNIACRSYGRKRKISPDKSTDKIK